MPSRKRNRPGKSTWPGRKQVWRQTGADGTFAGDTLGLVTDDMPGQRLLASGNARGKNHCAVDTLQTARSRAARPASRALPPRSARTGRGSTLCRRGGGFGPGSCRCGRPTNLVRLCDDLRTARVSASPRLGAFGASAWLSARLRKTLEPDPVDTAEGERPCRSPRHHSQRPRYADASPVLAEGLRGADVARTPGGDVRLRVPVREVALTGGEPTGAALRHSGRRARSP
jgi:hypothetical protein